MTTQILLADDSETIQKVFHIALSSFIVSIEEASSFAEANYKIKKKVSNQQYE